MRRFILRFSFFCAILLALGYAFDYWLSSRLMRRNHDELSSWTEIIEGKAQCDVAFIGNSRTYHGIVPEIIDSALQLNTYNFGIEGFQFNQQYDRYRLMMAKDIIPHYIVQTIDYAGTLQWDLFKDDQFLPYFWDLDMRRIALHKRYNVLELYLPLLRYYGQKEYILGTLFGYEWNSEHHKGWNGGIQAPWNPADWLRTDSITFVADPRTEAMFTEFLDDTRDRGIQVIFVYDPIYIGKTRKVRNLDDMYHRFDSLAAGRYIPVLDYTFCPISMDTTYFYDTEHLNSYGAETYSRILGHALDSVINSLNQ